MCPAGLSFSLSLLGPVSVIRVRVRVRGSISVSVDVGVDVGVGGCSVLERLIVFMNEMGMGSRWRGTRVF